MKSSPIIANCMIVDDDKVSRSMISHLIKKTDYLKLGYVCENGMEAHNILQTDDSVDILFLDIEMPEMSGLELLQTLNNKSVHVILTTSREQYAVEAFEYDVVDYLVKPINHARFLKATSRVLERLEDDNSNYSSQTFLFVRANHKIVKIDPKKIFYIEALSDYILIYTTDQKYVVHSTMKGIEKKLEIFKKFIRVHRSYIVNVEHIETVQEDVFINGKAIPIGRSYRNRFLAKLDIL